MWGFFVRFFQWSIQTAMILADIDRALDEELDNQFFVFARISSR